ncbi:MAG: UDP-N-acetylenolpyruvoylglucosamine reductase [Betaproteobacteria bacterium RIFCSPLOWO2_02_FULL_63_19]|nr:MAG: UDP-N-acetylenolpyruvoylglucosamine reductase [Betaproteobacteria bacterium RIFCSPLOWO2_02_FULL_63_19]
MIMGEPIRVPADALRGTLRLNEPMSRHVSWRAGGYAARCYVPADLSDLAAFLGSLPSDEPVCMVGLGSNLLVRDGGFRGTVVLTHGSRPALRLDGDCVYAEAGVPSPKVARFAANQGFDGAEFLAGIPGTVGGALAMNAGCYGTETWEVVARALTVDRCGELREHVPTEFDIGYRHCALPGGALGKDIWFAAAWLRFRAGNRNQARRRITELLEQRIRTQPLDLPNAGSVFRNPPGQHAAQLIEACGLKGFVIGGARISEKHANFIVNPKRRASAADIEKLITHARTTVKERFGIELQTEVRIVGEA